MALLAVVLTLGASAAPPVQEAVAIAALVPLQAAPATHSPVQVAPRPALRRARRAPAVGFDFSYDDNVPGA